MDKNPNNPQNRVNWDSTGEEYLIENYKTSKYKDLADWLSVYFGSKVTIRQLKMKLSELGLTKIKKPGDEWVL